MRTNPFELWAPNAQRVELVLDDESIEMSRKDKGYWRVARPTHDGERYRYSIDGRGPFPDPRSAWQPEGVHGPSVIVDHDAFAWHDDAFVQRPLAQAVFYELHVGTFSPEGTYAGAAKLLPHLRDLGITHVELMPLHAFPGERGWGYDGAALYAPHAAYGTPDELKAFVQAAHALELAVVLDVVYNHLGPDGAYASVFGPYFTDRVRTPWGEAVNFDSKLSDEVRTFVIGNVLLWLRDYHFDGLRLDAVHEIYDHSARHILEEISVEVAHLSARTGRDYTIIAESDLNNPRLVQPRDRGGYGLDAHWADDFHHAVHAFFTGERDGIHLDFGTLGDVAKALRQGYVFDGQHSTYRKRSHGRPPAHVQPAQLVVFAQNHDQTGNRALGERLSHLLELRISKAIAAIVLLSPFVPMLFQGEEWGATTSFFYFTDHGEELGKLVAEGRKRDFEIFGWATGEVPDPQRIETFERSKLLWNERNQAPHSDLLAWHRALISLRRQLPENTPATIEFDEEARWLSMLRGDTLILFNFSNKPQAVPLPEGNWTVQLSSHHDSALTPVPGHGTVIATRP